MDIKLPFDSTYNLAELNVILLNNELKEIGNIQHPLNFNANLYYNSYNEISFDVYMESNGEKETHWNNIKDLRIAHVEELNENFKLYISMDDSDALVKHVIGNSLCADELSNIILYDIEINTSEDILRDEYTSPTIFFSDNPKISLMDRVLEKAPHYTIGHIDDSLKGLQYSFSFDSTSIYDALMEIAEKIGCIFRFDTNTRTISAYDLKNYCRDCGKRYEEHTRVCPYCGSTDVILGDGRDTCITVSKDNIASLVSIDGDEDNYKTVLRIKTGDDLLDASIRNINPNGSEYIYYFTDDVLADMSPELVEKLNEYNEKNEYYQNDYTLTYQNAEYNALVDKYNSDTYKNYKYNEDGEEELTNNTFKKISNTDKGFSNVTALYYDNTDFSLYLEHSLMPYVLQQDVTIDEDVANLTQANLNNFALSSLEKSTSQSTVEIYLKKWCNMFLRNAYLITINTTNYDYEGGRADGWNYASWTGTITIATYGVDSESRTTGSMTLSLSDNYQVFLDERIMTTLKEQDDEIGSIYNIMKIDNEADFKTQLKLYSLGRLNSFVDAYQAGVDVMIEADQASPEAGFYEDIYVPLYDRLQWIIAERDVRASEVKLVDEVGTDISNLIYEIQKDLNFESFVGEDLYKLLKTYMREDVYTNSNVTSEGLSNAELIKLAQEIVTDANSEIKKIGYMQKTITSSLNNFLSLPEFKAYEGEFNLGNWIVTDVADQMYYQRLVSLQIGIVDGDMSINAEFSQVSQKGDELNDLKSVLSQTASLTTSIGEIKNSIIQASNSNEILQKWFTDGLDLTNIKIYSNAQNQSVVYDRNGILVRTYDDINQKYGDEQMKIINSGIAITKDNWQSVETAVGKFIYVDPLTSEQKTAYGVNAKVLVGNLIIGSELIIKTENNAFMVNDQGIIINTTSQMENRQMFAIQKDGVNQLYINSDGDLVGNNMTFNNGTFNGNITGGSINIGNGNFTVSSAGVVTIKQGSINLANAFMVNDQGQVTITKGSINLANAFTVDNNGNVYISKGSMNINNNFIVDSNGNLTAKGNAKFTGSITGSTISGGTISGTSIITDKDLTIGFNLYMGDIEDRATRRYLLFNDEYGLSFQNDVLTIGVNPQSGLTSIAKIWFSKNGAINIDSTNQINIVSDGYGILMQTQDGADMRFNINGDFKANKQLVVSSDERLKDNIKDANLSALIDILSVKEFNYKNDLQKTVGVIAQQFIGTPYEDIILRKGKDGMYAVDYNVILMALVQYIQKNLKGAKGLNEN